MVLPQLRAERGFERDELQTSAKRDNGKARAVMRAGSTR
jgi:hypothetical protein